MANFADALRSTPGLTDDERYDFDQISVTCSHMATLIGEDARNVEQLASFLGLLELARPTFIFDSCRIHKTPGDAIRLIKKSQAILARPGLKLSQSHYARSLISLLNRTNTTFVTTNYDIHIEIGLFSHEDLPRVRQPSLSVPTRFRSNECDIGLPSVYRHDGDGVDIFKLHGSVNWHSTENGVKIEDRICPTLQIIDNRRFKEGCMGIPEDFADHSQTHDPIIVPPTVLKPETNKLLRSQWVGAATAMSEAHKIWFVGYSFPESDSFMRYFLSTTLFENPHLNEIAVVDPNIDVIEYSARAIFSAPHHQNVFQSCPYKWESFGVERLLNGQWPPAVDSHEFRELEKTLRRQRVLKGIFNPDEEPERKVRTMRTRGRARGR